MPYQNVDIQVNGFAGVDFNDEPLDSQQIERVAKALREHRTETILPTITTDEIDRMALRLRTMRNLIDRDETLRRMMPAFHIEGPCLSPAEGYRGAHNPRWLQPARRDVLEPLIEAAGGPQRVAIVTLAPEVDKELAATRWLGELGIRVAAGHTDARLEILRDAVENGLSMFTHLGNGTTVTMHRHDNIVNRVLSLEQLTCSFIPDGTHVPFFVLKQYIKAAGLERCLFTSDCIAPAACPPGLFTFRGNIQLEVGADRVARFPGTPYFAGSAITMLDAHAHATGPLGFSEKEARWLCRDGPRKVLGLE